MRLKNCTYALITLWIIFCGFSLSTFGQSGSDKYQEVDLAIIKAKPEEYKNKRVTFTTTYFRYLTTFLPYMEKSGFKAGKHYFLQVKPRNLPVMMDKKDKAAELIPTLKPGTRVRLSGKIKKFSSEPDKTIFPHYYLELEKMEIIEEEEGEAKEEDLSDDFDPFEDKPLKVPVKKQR